jgi:hypothetical protein
MMTAERPQITGCHFPFPAAGYMEKAGTGYRFVPVQGNPIL